jgi:hypothetical protein
MIAERYASSNGLKMYITTANKLEVVVGDGTYTVTKTGTLTTLCDGNWHLVGLTGNRIGNLQLYVDDVTDGTATDITSLGSISSTTTFQVGFLSADYFSGYIGEVQRSRYTDIAQSNVNTTTLTSAYRNGIPETWIGGSPQVVFWDDFRGNSNTQMLNDKSGTGNNLTGVNVTTADQVRGSYPSR